MKNSNGICGRQPSASAIEISHSVGPLTNHPPPPSSAVRSKRSPIAIIEIILSMCRTIKYLALERYTGERLSAIA